MTSFDHLHTRREFLRNATLLALAGTAPAFLLRSARAAEAGARGEPVLVVVQLAGGNDGLNTVVPFTNDEYFRRRPRLAIRQPGELIRLDDHTAFHHSLQALMPWMERGQLAVVQGVGYPNPDRSHFRSTEIWETAVDSHQSSTTGWVGRYLDATCAGKPHPDPTAALAIGTERPQSFQGHLGLGVAMSQPEAFGYVEGLGGDDTGNFRHLNETASAASTGSDSNLDFLRQTSLNATMSASRIRGAARRSGQQVSYPASRIGQQLRIVARMIGGGMPTRVYYVSHGGFDTHANQAGTHTNLLRQMADAIAAFQRDLEAMNEADRVVIATFSEFGRRVAENASGGTDHGTAAPMMLMGRHVRGGLHGQAPSLTSLDGGDLRHTVDFRQVYASLLGGWLNAPVSEVLGRPFEAVPGLIA